MPLMLLLRPPLVLLLRQHLPPLCRPCCCHCWRRFAFAWFLTDLPTFSVFSTRVQRPLRNLCFCLSPALRSCRAIALLCGGRLQPSWPLPTTVCLLLMSLVRVQPLLHRLVRADTCRRVYFIFYCLFLLSCGYPKAK